MLSEQYKNRIKHLSGILQENRKRIDFLRNRFLSRYKSPSAIRIAENVFAQILASDPSKNKQYVQWLINLYDVDRLRMEDLYKATEYLSFFDSLKRKNLVPEDKKDIGQIRSLQELFKIISKLGGTGEIKNDEKYLIKDRFFINGGQAELLFEDNKWLVVSPLTYDASKFYACTTQWCTKNPDQFKSYSSQGPLIIAIDKYKLNSNDSSRRYQLHFESEGFMDFNDSPIKINSILKANPSLAVALSPVIRKAITSGFHVLHPDEEKALSDKEENNTYISYDILPDDVKDAVRKANIEKGWVIHPSWINDMTEEEKNSYINNRLKKNGAKYVKSELFSLMNNRQKAFYFKKAISSNDRVPKEIVEIADPQFIRFYLEEIVKTKGTVDNYIYELMNDDLKKAYLDKISRIGTTLIPQRQVYDMSDQQVKKVSDKIFNERANMDDGFFKGMSDKMKNYYIGRIYSKFGEKNTKDHLTIYQLDWGKTYGFLS
jgi:hypothetical protein